MRFLVRVIGKLTSWFKREGVEGQYIPVTAPRGLTNPIIDIN